jgi:hypothetical protein
VKARPSFEKRRKETQRQERNRDKEERRKTRRDERLQRALTGTPSGESEIDVLQGTLGPEDSDTGHEAAVVRLPRAGEADIAVSSRTGAEAISSKDSIGAAKQ